jgi:hypothetical protein
MKQMVNSLSLDDLTFLGVLLGTALLVACFCTEGCRFLTVPALVILLPSLLYGVR